MKLIRPKRIDIVEGSGKALHILEGQSCDQIQVLVDIALLPDSLHRSSGPAEIHRPPDLPDGIGIRRLHSDLQLDKPRPHTAQDLKFFLIQQIRRHFKMKIRDSSVMLCNIFPYGSGMLMPAVKRPVHELDLRHFLVDKKLQFPPDRPEIAES